LISRAILTLPLSCGVVLQPLGASLLTALIVTILAPANLTTHLSAAVIESAGLVANNCVWYRNNNIVRLFVALFNFFIGLDNLVI
jgi:branched-subunit amino acid transport protein